MGEVDDEEVSHGLDTARSGLMDQKDSDEEILRIRKRIHELVNIMQTYILREFRASRTIFYVDLAWEKPTMKKFLTGWIRRAVV